MATINSVTAPTDQSGLLASALAGNAVNSGTATSQGYTASEATAAHRYNVDGVGIAGKAEANTYDPTKATASTYDAQNMTAQGYDAAKTGSQGYDAAQADLAKWNVDNNQLVQNQLSSVLSQTNPLMKSAEAKAKQEMNARGLLNSSMAVKAGQSALYDYAVPIATSDATTLANSAKYNADASNQIAQFNAGAKNAASQFTAGAANAASLANQQATNAASQFNATAQNAAAAANQNAQNAAGQFNAQSQTQVSLANQASADQAGQFNAGAKNQTSQFNAAAANALQQQNLSNEQQTALANAAARNAAAQFGASAANQASITNAQLQSQASLANAEIAKSVAMQQLDSAFKAQVANADNQTKVAMQEMQSQAQLQLANIEATYKSQMQTSQSAANMYQQAVKNITDITNNPDLDTSGKEAAIKVQTDMLNDSLKAFKAIGQTNVAQTLNFNAPSVVSQTESQKNRAAIESFYQGILGRPADPQGLASWMQAVDSGSITLEQAKQGFYGSDEYRKKAGG